ncbi:hypothetical protein BDZ89DRAFT_802701 [Hymenopellis radicata]|nr:hypothetical protein BDZ89DRAFT_802701 [Hymenopellis radicata]
MSTQVSSFETQVVNTLEENFKSRCALCLCLLEDALQNCHILGNAERRSQLLQETAVQYHLVPSDFSRESAESGFRLCANCHLGWMTPKVGGLQRLAFVPCREVCAHLLRKLKEDKNTTVDDVRNRNIPFDILICLSRF